VTANGLIVSMIAETDPLIGGTFFYRWNDIDHGGLACARNSRLAKLLGDIWPGRLHGLGGGMEEIRIHI
jgi:hypothetical protein